MAVGAQLRLVVLGGDAKHVVAGDADAVDNLLRLGCRFGFGFLFLSHNRILAHRRELGGAGIGARAVSAWCGKGDGGKNKAHRKGLAQVRHEEVVFSFFRMLSDAEALSFQRVVLQNRM